MLLYNRQLKIWIGRRLNSDLWQLPQGGVEKGVSLPETALRELQEELGVGRADLGLPRQLEATHRYEWADPPSYWRHKFKGQKQTFWVVPFLGRDETISVRTVEHPEFSDWRWVAAEELLEAVEPVRRAGYVAPLQEFIALRVTF